MFNLTYKKYKLLFFLLILSINLQLYGTPPAWNPPSNLYFNMNVIARLQHPDEQYSINEFDLVAAFVDDKCRGVTSPVDSLGGLLFLSIGSNQTIGEIVTFKAYIADENIIVNIDQMMVFENQALIGDFDNPFIFTYEPPDPTFSLSTAVSPAGAGWIDIVPEQHTYDIGQLITINATAENEYLFSNWTGDTDYIDDPASPSITLTMPDRDVELTALFDLIPFFLITASSGEGGSIDPEGDILVMSGNHQGFNIMAENCYLIKDVLVDGSSVGIVESYQFNNISDNHTIVAQFEIQTHQIDAIAGDGGTITPAGVIQVDCGANRSFVIESDDCYFIQDVIVDGQSVGAVSFFEFTNITDNHTIEVQFGYNESFSITASANQGGSIEPTGEISVSCLDNILFEIQADDCYQLQDVLVDGESVGAVSSYLFENILEDHSIEAVFEIKTYQVSASAQEGGYIMPAGDIQVDCGSNQLIEIFANDCYVISDVLVDGLSIGPVENFEFENISENHTIEVFFEIITYHISTSTNEGGNIVPPGEIVVDCGSNHVFEIQTDDCYVVHDVLIDNISVGAVSSWIFEDIASDHTIEVYFEFVDTYTVTASAGPNGSIQPSGEISVNCLENQMFEIFADSCYQVSDVLIDGESIGAVTSFQFDHVANNHTIQVLFEPITYIIYSSADTGGNIVPSGNVTVNCGENQSFIIQHDDCHVLKDVLVDGISIGPFTSYEFENVLDNHTIEAVLEVITYQLNASAGEGGSIIPSGTITVDCGSNISFDILTDDCYIIKDVMVDGISIGAVPSYTIENVSGNHTVDIQFEPVESYIVTAFTGTGGSIEPGGEVVVNCLENQIFEISPDECYQISDVIIDGQSIGPVSSYEFETVTGNHSIEAVFEIISYQITANAHEGGSIEPAGDIAADCGSGMVFMIVPDECYIISDVVVDGQSMGPVTSYEFQNIAGNHAIEACFELKQFEITSSANEGGSIEPFGNIVVDCGENLLFEISPDTCYIIKDVLIDGVSIGAVSYFEFEDVTDNHTIDVEFEFLHSFVITASAGIGGSIEPSGDVAVNCLDNSVFNIQADDCFEIYDVLVDAQSMGPITSWEFEDVTGNHTIEAIFELKTYEITASASAGGSIEPYGDIEVDCGTDHTFSFNADACYQIIDVIVDGQSVGPVSSYEFDNVTDNHSIEVVFEIISYQVTATASEGGSIDPIGTVAVECGTNQLFSIHADECYELHDVVVNGQSIGPVTSYEFENITDNHTIEAIFEKTIYEVEATAGEGGSIDPSGNISVDCGSNLVFNIEADDCYEILDVEVDGQSIGPVSTYEFADIASNHSISALFELKTYQITALAGEGGSIEPSGEIIADCGTNMVFSIIPDECHEILDVLIDGESIGVAASYELQNIRDNHTIEAIFELKTFQISAVAGEGGLIEPVGDSVVDCGSDLALYISADECYDILDVIVDGQNIGPVTSYEFINIMDNHTVEAVFELKTFTLTAATNDGGTIEPYGDIIVDCGTNVTFTINAQECYDIADVLIDGESIGPVSSLEFVNVMSNHTINALFNIKTFVITASAGDNGYIIPEGAVMVNCGSDKLFEIEAEEGFEISDVLIDDESVGPIASYQFLYVIQNHTIQAYFKSTETNLQPVSCLTEIFPNPFSNTIHITNAAFIKKLEITDIYGHVLISENYNNLASITVSTSFLPKGIYFMKVTYDSNRSEIHKLIKQ